MSEQWAMPEGPFSGASSAQRESGAASGPDVAGYVDVSERAGTPRTWGDGGAAAALETKDHAAHARAVAATKEKRLPDSRGIGFMGMTSRT